jgi:PKD repeat protein
VSLSLTVDRTTVQRNGVVRFSLTRPDTGAPVEGSLVVDGQRVPIGPDGVATYRFRTAGRVLVTATAPSAAGGTLNAGTVTIDVVTPFESGIPGVAGGSPTDVDDDGRYEDVDGDGRFDFVDVINLVFADWARINADPTGRDAMDFDGSGRIDFVDVIDLVFELQQRP